MVTTLWWDMNNTIDPTRYRSFSTLLRDAVFVDLQNLKASKLFYLLNEQKSSHSRACLLEKMHARSYSTAMRTLTWL
ncbi:hypothetical protein T4B_1369 [Trichinella pseudospiralis]|uniref:Uncharacterized protein n=1 Tax=Trichinella pseudospiralis TaxID=6337 RepID=A0A0V1IRY8_TRIPS|nr:hypothetical protein T4B_1369 [Trichinella pseudospiralis]